MKKIELNSAVSMPSDGFVNKSILAQRYTVSTRTIDNWMQERIIPFTKIGGVVRFRISEVDAALSRFAVKN